MIRSVVAILICEGVMTNIPFLYASPVAFPGTDAARYSERDGTVSLHGEKMQE